ncbi:alpha/beta hydrolase [Microvirga sp.]|uniref:alpha/beta hydrolase n=1 Tax=Microvirga sp. TaxID=1873136 RepID=UPI003919A83C
MASLTMQLLGATLSLPAILAAVPPVAAAEPKSSIVLVHGAFVDGSGWQGVYNILKKDGYDVSIVQNPTESLAGDVAATKQVIGSQNKPVILVGHSYGGMVITEAGNDPKVAALVYIAAFAPDAGESVASINSKPVPGAPVAPIVPMNGALMVDKAKFHESFAADVDPQTASFMADSQTPWGEEALKGTISTLAWKSKPSWYIVTAQDRMIAPDAQRMMAKRAGATISEAQASHSVYVSQPETVARVIKAAAEKVANSPTR